MTKKILPLAALACVLFLAASAATAPVTAAPVSLNAPLAEMAGSAELVRWRWRWRRNAYPSGITLFTVPGLYWGPAWWDANYARLCWRQIQPCRHCAYNWAYTC